MLKLFNKDKESITYKGFYETEKEPFKYYISNCIELVDCDILSFHAIYHNGRTEVSGKAFDRTEKSFYCVCSFDDEKATLQVITTITYSDGEEKNAIDTFYFNEDEVIVVSQSKEFGQYERSIPIFSNSLVRR